MSVSKGFGIMAGHPSLIQLGNWVKEPHSPGESPLIQVMPLLRSFNKLFCVLCFSVLGYSVSKMHGVYLELLEAT